MPPIPASVSSTANQFLLVFTVQKYRAGRAKVNRPDAPHDCDRRASVKIRAIRVGYFILRSCEFCLASSPRARCISGIISG